MILKKFFFVSCLFFFYIGSVGERRAQGGKEANSYRGDWESASQVFYIRTCASGLFVKVNFWLTCMFVCLCVLGVRVKKKKYKEGKKPSAPSVCCAWVKQSKTKKEHISAFAFTDCLRVKSSVTMTCLGESECFFSSSLIFWLISLVWFTIRITVVLCSNIVWASTLSLSTMFSVLNMLAFLFLSVCFIVLVFFFPL